MSVTLADLHKPDNDPASVTSTVDLSELQRYHVAIVLDLFQAKGTRGKLVDAFTEDAVYEDLFASCKNRDEVVVKLNSAGQLLNLPMLVASTTTHKAVVSAVSPAKTRSGSREVQADEILVNFKHTFCFKAPLPEKARSVTMDTTLVIYSTPEGIVRLQDRTDADIPDNSILTLFRKMNAVGVPKVVHNAQDDQEDAEKVLKYQRD